MDIIIPLNSPQTDDADKEISEAIPLNGDADDWYRRYQRLLSLTRKFERKSSEVSQKLERYHDLVRYQRAELHEAGLISDAEYAELLSDPKSVSRLEGYDKLKYELSMVRMELAAIQQGIKTEWKPGEPSGDTVADFGVFMTHHSEVETARNLALKDLAVAREALPGKNSEHGSGFFRATTVPENLRSIKGLVRRKDSSRGKKGEIYSACTIDDVVKWSMTLRGGKQLGLDFMFDDGPIFEEDDAHSPCSSGYCE